MKGITMKLILFDIDGTMLYSNGNGKIALIEAIEKIFGNIANDSINPAGKTDPQIIYEMIEHRINKSELDQKLPKIFTCYLENLKQYYTVSRGVGVYDGVQKLIRQLKDLNTNIIGLLTGNIYRGAMIKLGLFGLEQYFELGAYGDDGFYRQQLPDVALKRAVNKTNRTFSDKDIVIIGDTVNDVECGRHLNVKSIVVCTNKKTEAELKAANPDHFFHDFNNTEKVIEAILT